MRCFVALVLCVSLLICGCTNMNNPVDHAINLRNKVLDSNGCTFSAQINADYGDTLYVFSLDCISDKEGNLSFIVRKPATIAGITGKISAQGGSITFDDKILAFQMLADGELSPVAAPWIFLNTIRSGYIRGCSANDGSYQIEIDDTYDENALRLNIFIDNNLPSGCEIFWEGRRAVSIEVDNFIYL